MTRPNLFDFATSELSQDAFLCWLIANAGYEGDLELQTLGRAFIGWLWSAARREPVDPKQIRLLGPPHRQVEHIDLLFDAEVAGRLTRFVIENKTDTSHHDDQLRRYKEAAGRDGHDLVLIYFKTGYHFAADARAVDHGYAVIGLKEWVGFLNAHEAKHDILNDYRRCAARWLAEREAALAALQTRRGHETLSKDYVQFEFIQQLASRCRETIAGEAIHRGTNMGGTPWTHYRFAAFPGALTSGIGEVLFHRVDARKDDGGERQYYLSTRQYGAVKEKLEARTKKLSRLRAHIAAFEEAVRSSGCDLKFSRAARDHQGANESEIGILFFGDETNTVQIVLEKFPRVHGAFVAALRREVPGVA